jgi:hypothetical protein
MGEPGSRPKNITEVDCCISPETLKKMESKTAGKGKKKVSAFDLLKGTQTQMLTKKRAKENSSSASNI